jgi:hypothetical protein
MPARTELDRLAAARPPIVDHPEWIVGPAAENDILRQILATTRVTTGRRTPAGRAPARGWSRRPLIGLAAATAVLAIAGSGVLIASATAHRHTHARGSAHRLASPAALPPDRVIAALAAKAVDAASRRYILYVRTSYAAGTTVGGVAAMATWTKGISDREKLFNGAGAILDDESAVISHGMRVRRFVDYTSRTWQTDSIAARSHGSGPPPGQLIRQLLAPGAAQLQQAPGKHRPDNPRRSVTAVSVHGTRMILVTISYPQPLPSGPAAPAPLLGSTEMLPATEGHQSVVTEQVWLDESTDLPVRAEFTAPGGRVLMAETFAWLSPSDANRAVLSPAPVPAGFRLTQELAH